MTLSASFLPILVSPILTDACWEIREHKLSPLAHVASGQTAFTTTRLSVLEGLSTELAMALLACVTRNTTFLSAGTVPLRTNTGREVRKRQVYALTNITISQGTTPFADTGISFKFCTATQRITAPACIASIAPTMVILGADVRSKQQLILVSFANSALYRRIGRKMQGLCWQFHGTTKRTSRLPRVHFFIFAFLP
jgi:hypothetical protein